MENRDILYQNPLTGKCPYHLSCDHPQPFQVHWHGEMEIFYLLPESGPGVITVDGEEHVPIEHTLSARNVYFVGSTVVHSLTSASPDAVLLVLEMGFPLLGEDFNLFARHRFAEPLLRFGEDAPENLAPLEALFLALADEPVVRNIRRAGESSMEYTLSRMRVSSLLFRIAAFLAENMPMTDVSAGQLRTIQAMQAVQSALSYVRENYSRPITVEYAAALTGYEKSRFCQLFKQAVGVSFHRYLTDCRTAAALSMLRETALPVSVIAEAVGIPQAKTFSRLMREKYGSSPRKLRENK